MQTISFEVQLIGFRKVSHPLRQKPIKILLHLSKFVFKWPKLEFRVFIYKIDLFLLRFGVPICAKLEYNW